jgi:hypothetical protein
LGNVQQAEGQVCLLTPWGELSVKQVTKGIRRLWQGARRFVARAIQGRVPCRVRRYSGDGEIEDRGWLACGARYVISFPTIQLDKSGDYTYEMRSLPAVDCSVIFDIGRHSNRGETGLRDLVAEAEVLLHAELSDCSGRIVGQFGGPLGQWVFCSGGGYGYFWHEALQDIKLNDLGCCRLIVRVVAEDQTCPRIAVIPRVQGGGLPPP